MLKEKDKAPQFTAHIETGEKVSLADYKGKKLILYFYPKDLTPGCTLQARDLSINIEKLTSAGYEVLGVSADTQKRHCTFIEKLNIKFHLISDPELHLIKLYDAWGPKKFMGREYEGIYRMTYIIDEEGLIEKIIRKVKTNAHYDQIMADH